MGNASVKASGDRIHPIRVWHVLIVVFYAIFWSVICLLRDSGHGGPHHDEVIGLLASNAKEGSFAQMLMENAAPLNDIVPASQWHAYTHNDGVVGLSAIRDDVMHGDKHPPLAFWMFNRWLAQFSNGGYSHALVLTLIQILAAAAVLGFTVWRYTARPSTALLAFVVFLAGNSAIFTAVWVRQYGLFVFCYACLVLVSGELVRRRIGAAQNFALLTLLALSCLAGMMTQYTFFTMSLPIHLAILGVLAWRRQWHQFANVLASYAIAGIVFVWLMPGVFTHASEASKGQSLALQISDALWGLPRMVIPLPSSLPLAVVSIVGIAVLVTPFILAAIVFCKEQRSRSVPSDSLGGGAPLPDYPDPRVPLFGMLGAGLLQFSMVAIGLFPGWATGENHMCSFWLLTVLAFVLCLEHLPSAHTRRILVVVSLSGMLGMQVLFTWHCHRILPRVNTSYIHSLTHDLVAIDNLSRGFVLQITDLVPANEKVLATDSERLAARLVDGSLAAYQKVLYLPMDSSVRDGKALVMAAAERSGWNAKELPVVHTGMYEAFLIQRIAE